jgi:hypothetical protein
MSLRFSNYSEEAMGKGESSRISVPQSMAFYEYDNYISMYLNQSNAFSLPME